MNRLSSTLGARLGRDGPPSAVAAPELERLTREQASWADTESSARAEEGFRRILERGEKLAQICQGWLDGAKKRLDDAIAGGAES